MQLCDLWTSSISSQEYIDFLRGLTEQIVDLKTMKLRDLDSVVTTCRIPEEQPDGTDARCVIAQIMNLLHPDGYWEMSTNLAKLLGLNEDIKVCGFIIVFSLYCMAHLFSYGSSTMFVRQT